MRNRTKIAVAAAATVALVGALIGCTAQNQENPFDGLSQEELAEIAEQYTFHEFVFECPTDDYGLVKTVAYAHSNYGPSSSGDSPKRVNPDSVSLPLPDGTPSERWEAFKANLCTDTFLALSWGHVLGNEIVPGTDTRVFDIEGNDGLAMADVNIEEINNLADSLLFHEGDDLVEFAKANKEYQHYVNTLVAVLGQFNLFGEHSFESWQNWHLVPLSAGIGDLEENDVQESLPALLFGVTLKGQCEPVALYGVNLSDQRPEKFHPEDLGCVPEETPPPDAQCVENCGSEPVCEHDCGEGPGKDPSKSSTLVVDPVITGPAGPINQSESTQLQTDPEGDAVKAEQEAAQNNQQQQQQHQDAVEESNDVGADTVEEGDSDPGW